MMSSHTEINKEYGEGHWVFVTTMSRSSIAKRRRREYERMHGILDDETVLKRMCPVLVCVNPEHCRVWSAGVAAQEMLAAYAEEGTVEAVSDRLGVSVQYVKETLAKEGVIELAPRSAQLTGEALERATLLLQEGLPTRWVAEDIGASRHVVDRLRGSLDLKVDPEWVRVQLSCRKDKELAPLHDLFNPQIGVAA